jgi:SAM-dependent methyltransferase
MGIPGNSGKTPETDDPMRRSFSEAELTMPRAKPRSLGVSTAYRAMAVARRLVGREKLLKLSLEAAWLTRRFAFELSTEVFGPSFHQVALGLTDELLFAHLPARASVLDVGCGTGRWSRTAARRAASVVGMDYDADKLAVARQAAAQEGLTNVEFLRGDVTRDLAGRHFDVALLSHVLEHIDDPDTFLVSMHKVASVLIIEVPDFEGDYLNVARHAVGCKFYSDADHVREYTAEILRAQIDRTGWRMRHQERRAGSLLAVVERPARNDNT